MRNSRTVAITGFTSIQLKRFRYTAALVCVLLSACGGGSSTGSGIQSGQDDGDTNQNPNQNPTTGLEGIRLPNVGEINTRSPDIAVDSQGRQHLVMADINGAFIYARCDSNCASQAAWTSVEIQSFDLGSTDSIVPKLKLDSADRPQVMVLRTNSVLSSVPSWYFNCSAANCLDSAAWSGGSVVSPLAMIDHDLSSVSGFTLNNNDKPRVSWLGSPGVLSFEDDALFYASCDDNCTQESSWTTNTVATFNFSSSTMANLVIDSLDRPHVVFIDEEIGFADTVDVTYIACVALCNTVNAQWHAPVVLATLNQDVLELESVKLLVDSQDNLSVIAYDGGAANPLSLFQCAGTCDTVSSWQQSIPISTSSFTEDIVRFGSGLDAKLLDNALAIQFIAKKREDTLPALMYRATCTGFCAIQASWSVSKIADTSAIDLGPAEGCAFVGTQISPPTSIANNMASYVTVPSWYCGSFDFIEIDDAGNRELVSNPDVRFFEIATVVQVN